MTDTKTRHEECKAMMAAPYPCYCAVCKVHGKSKQPDTCWRCDARLSIDAKEDGRRVCPDGAACWQRLDAKMRAHEPSLRGARR